MSRAARLSGGKRGSAGESHEPVMNWIELFRVGARQHRPEELVEIGHVDIVIDDDDIFAGIGRGAALRGDMARLNRMAGVALLDRDAVQEARAADLVAPDLAHFGHAGIGHVLLDHRRAQDGAVARHLVRPAAHRRHAQKDRIVAVVDCLDVEHGRHRRAARVMPGPFAERTFHLAAVGRHIAFEHDLGVGRKRQARHLAAHHLYRPPAHPADDIDLEHAVGRLDAAIEESERIAAQHHDERHRLSFGEIFRAVEIAVMPGGDQNADRFLVMDLRAIGAGIEPVLFRIARDAVGAGADITPAILFVPDRRREFEHVDVVAGQNIFEHRPGLDDLMRDGARILEIGLAIAVAQFPFAEIVGKAQGHVAPLAGKDVHEQAKALGATGNLVEHDAGTVLGAQHCLGRKSDILLPAGALNLAHLAEPFGISEPLAQIIIGNMGGEIAALAHDPPVFDALARRLRGNPHRRRPIIASPCPCSTRFLRAATARICATSPRR